MEMETETTTATRPWECDACGMIHTHYDGHHHNLRAITAGPFFPDLKYNPKCHCGWHEVVAMMDAGVLDAIPKAVQEDLEDY